MKRIAFLLAAVMILGLVLGPWGLASAARTAPKTAADIEAMVTINEPPKGWDPKTATDEELSLYNYPPRPNDPDPSRQKELMEQWESAVSGEWVRPTFGDPDPRFDHDYAVIEMGWLEVVSLRKEGNEQAAAEMAARLRAMEEECDIYLEDKYGIVRTPDPSAQTDVIADTQGSDLWGGVCSRDTYTRATGNWTQPTAFTSSSSYWPAYAVQWVGLGGIGQP